MVEEMYLQEAKDQDQDQDQDQPLPTTSPPPSTFNTSDNDQPQCFPAIESDIIRFGATSGDVSLTLGLRHSGEDFFPG